MEGWREGGSEGERECIIGILMHACMHTHVWTHEIKSKKIFVATTNLILHVLYMQTQYYQYKFINEPITHTQPACHIPTHSCQ